MTINYIPVLSVRPSELVALTEVPDIAKDRMLPCFLIRPWLGRGSLSRATGRILQGVGARSWIAELDQSFDGSHEDFDDEIAALRDSEGNFVNWRNFVGELPNAIPSAQVVGDAAVFRGQVENLLGLRRGVAIRFDKRVIADVAPFLEALEGIGSNHLTIIFDYGQRDERLLHEIIPAVQDCRTAIRIHPDARIAVSATTFPRQFDDLGSEAIFERSFFSNVVRETPSNALIYSDHGSTRVRDDVRGGTVPRPRIDLPLDDRWHFFRSDLVYDKELPSEDYKELRKEAYQDMAEEAVRSKFWDKSLNIWGTQFIKITQLGSEWGINSPAKATACRINIHLTRQALYGEAPKPADFEEDWVD